MEVSAAMVAAALCCAGACTLALYLYHILWQAPEKVRAALRRQGIGGPRPSFPYGNLAEMKQAAADAKKKAASQQRGGIVHDYRPVVFPFYEKWREEYGPVFSYSIGNMVLLHASRADVVRDLSLCVSPLDLGKSSYMEVAHRPLFGGGILKSSGEAWAHQRRLIAPEFFPDKVKAMVGLMVGSARALVDLWADKLLMMQDEAGSNNGDDHGGLELRIDDDLRAYSADVISKACFGSSYAKGERIFAMIRELQKTVSRPSLLAEMSGLGFLPTRSNRAAWRLNRMVRVLILDLVRESGGDEGSNLLNAMLRSAAASSSSAAAAEDFIVDNCKNIYFAGYESTAVTAAWCMMLLALHPEWQSRVRDEVRQACAGAAAPDFSCLQKMKKLTMVIQETLRLYPAGSVVSRRALRDVTLGGVRVPAGVNIYVPVSTVHLDAEVWGTGAREFDPERFAVGARPQPPPHGYLPFGAGARTCLGQGFAMAELKVLLALVLSRFQLGLSPDYVHSPALRLIVEPEQGMRLVLRSVGPTC